jgi:hypothetical protein
MSALWDSVDPPDPESQPDAAKLAAIAASVGVIQAT